MGITQNELQEFITVFNSISAYDLSGYSINSLTRRVDKVLLDGGLSFQELIHTINSDSAYCERVMKQITVNTTELFRDTAMWHELQYKLLPTLEHKHKLRIWHAGCSNGLEAYSLAILLKYKKILQKSSIIGSDINDEMIQQARNGEYKIRLHQELIESFDKAMKENPYDNVLRPVSFHDFFEVNVKKELVFVKKELKKHTKFERINLVDFAEEEVYSNSFDIIFCRNVLIYFTQDLQKKIISQFHNMLSPDGYLVLGMQENITWHAESLFEKKGLFYKKCETSCI